MSIKLLKDFIESRKIARILVFLIALEIFYFSSLEGDKIQNSVFSLSVIYHFSVFFLLNFFLLVSLNNKKRIKISLFLFSIFLSLVYSILDEIHQVFVPFRDASLHDILVNNLGIFSSSLVYIRLKNHNR
ncbi:MAG: hypothetical protein KatS3mg001_231 [Candidatus Pacearchaeota archaeon]|nr:MAG: hypothetical protein KatS3mg001_231 [Candidatus Pacearchaeota archaeon]